MIIYLYQNTAGHFICHAVKTISKIYIHYSEIAATPVGMTLFYNNKRNSMVMMGIQFRYCIANPLALCVSSSSTLFVGNAQSIPFKMRSIIPWKAKSAS